jgi:hypothetical protein
MPPELNSFFALIGLGMALLFSLIFAFKVEERVTGLATVFLAVATVVLAWVSYKQLSILSGQLEEMRAEQRPWVHSKDMPVVTQFLYLPSGNIHLEMKIYMENVGRLPAQDTSGRMLILGGGVIDDNLRNDCARAEWRDLLGVPGVRGVTIFPRETAPEGLFSDINKDDITVDKVGNSFAPLIVGCIAYRFPEGDTYHHTPFICILTLKIPGGIPRERREFLPDEFVCLRQPFAQLYRAD